MQFLFWFNGEVNVDIIFVVFNVGVYVLFVEMFDDSGVKYIDFVNEVGNKQVFWFFVNFVWCIILFNMIFVYYYNFV